MTIENEQDTRKPSTIRFVLPSGTSLRIDLDGIFFKGRYLLQEEIEEGLREFVTEAYATNSCEIPPSGKNLDRRIQLVLWGQPTLNIYKDRVIYKGELCCSDPYVVEGLRAFIFAHTNSYTAMGSAGITETSAEEDL